MPPPALEILLQAIDKVSKPLDKISKKLTDTGKTFTDVGKKFAIAGGAITATMTLMVKSATDYAVQLDKMSKASGVAVDVLAKFRYAAEQEHASTEAMSKGLTLLSRALYDASKGVGEGKIAFDELGFSVYDVGGKLKPVDEAFLELVDRFGKVTDESKLTGMAMKVFGRAGVELVPFMRLGREEIEKLGDEAGNLGLIMGIESVRAFKAFDDAAVAVRSGIRGLFIQFSEALIPSLIVGVELVKDFVINAIAWSKQNKELFGTISKIAVGIAAFLTVFGGLLLGIGLFLKIAGFLSKALAVLSKGFVIFALKIALPIAAIAVIVFMAKAIIKSFDTIKTSLSKLLESFISFGEASAKIFEGLFYALTFRPKKAWDTMKQGVSMAKVAMLDGFIAMGEGAEEVFGNFREITTDTFESVVEKFKEMKDSLSERLKEFGGEVPEQLEEMKSALELFWEDFRLGFLGSFITVETFGKEMFSRLSSTMAQTFHDFTKGTRDFSKTWQSFLDSLSLSFFKSISEMVLFWVAGEKQKAASTLAWKVLTIAATAAVSAAKAVASVFAALPWFFAIPAAVGVASTVKSFVGSLEEGGIAMKPMLKVVGDVPEAIIPLSKLQTPGRGGIVIENLNIQFPEVTTFQDWVEADPELIKEVTERKILPAFKILAEEGKVEEVVKI